MPTPYDNWLDPPDPEEDDDLDDDFDPDIEEIKHDPHYGCRIENGLTVFEEDFLYDPMRGKE